MGEVFTHPFEVVPLIKDRLIDFIRCRVAATGGITPIKKLTTLCEIFGVKTAFQEGGRMTPLTRLPAIMSTFPAAPSVFRKRTISRRSCTKCFPASEKSERVILYGSDKPGLGVDINEELASRNPLGPIPDGGAYPTGRTVDGTVVKP